MLILSKMYPIKFKIYNTAFIEQYVVNWLLDISDKLQIRDEGSLLDDTALKNFVLYVSQSFFDDCLIVILIYIFGCYK